MGWRGPGRVSVRPSTVGCTAWYTRLKIRPSPVPVGPRHRRCLLECLRRDLDRNAFTALGSIRIAFSTR